MWLYTLLVSIYIFGYDQGDNRVHSEKKNYYYYIAIFFSSEWLVLNRHLRKRHGLKKKVAKKICVGGRSEEKKEEGEVWILCGCCFLTSLAALNVLFATHLWFGSACEKKKSFSWKKNIRRVDFFRALKKIPLLNFFWGKIKDSWEAPDCKVFKKRGNSIRFNNCHHQHVI